LPLCLHVGPRLGSRFQHHQNTRVVRDFISVGGLEFPGRDLKHDSRRLIAKVVAPYRTLVVDFAARCDDRGIANRNQRCRRASEIRELHRLEQGPIGKKPDGAVSIDSPVVIAEQQRRCVT
jgi:hypothetical protein